MIGETLGHYRIEAELGTGGMGKVYRAVDVHLGRPVALKVLLPSALADPERSRRFTQEARAASALNHPHIVTVFELGEAHIGGRDLHYIVMEYVAGSTLDKAINGQPLPLTDALRYGSQVAGALAAAHDAGIVHRDLKPGNLIVNEHGQVKILDFGLAKLSETEPADAFAATESVRIDDSPKTEYGTIVGTVAYMSPEQAEGRRLDRRSDIFSLGVVLYEMLTGRQPFTGVSKISVLSSIIHKEVPALPAAIPAAVERAVARCLRKDPQRRWQTAADLQVELDELLFDLERPPTPRPAESSPLRAAPAQPARVTRRNWWGVAAASLAAGGAGGFVFGRRSAPKAELHFQRLTFRRGDINGARFAPDNGTVIYTAAWDGGRNDVYQARIGNRESRPLGFPEARVAAVSPTGELALLTGQFSGQAPGFGVPATLARVPLAGGAPREVLEDVSEADWSPDGAQLAVGRRVNGRFRIEYPIGKVLLETDSPRPPNGLRISPDGRWIAFFDYDPQLGDFVLTVMSTVDGQKRALSKGWRAIGRTAWSPRGDEVWTSGGRLGSEPVIVAVPLNGGPERVLAWPQGWMALHDVARDGAILAAAQDSRIAILCQPPGEKSEKDLSWFDTSFLRELSRDGRVLIFNEVAYGQEGNVAIYLRKTDGSPAVRLGEGARPTLSPDGKWVACIRNEGGRRELTLIPTGPGEGRKLTAAGFRYDSAEWFPDGRRLLVVGAADPQQPPRTYVQPLDGGAPMAVTTEGVRGHCVSPDGRVFLAVHQGRLMAFSLDPAANPPAPRVIGSAEPGNLALRWTPDGRAIFVQSIGLDQAVARIYRVDAASGRREVWKEIRPADPVGVTMGPAWVTPDGSAYAYTYYRDLASLFVIRGVGA